MDHEAPRDPAEQQRRELLANVKKAARAVLSYASILLSSLTAVLYLLGYRYLRALFDFFGLSLTAADLSFPTVVASSIPVVTALSWIFLFEFLLVVVPAAVLVCLSERRKGVYLWCQDRLHRALTPKKRTASYQRITESSLNKLYVKVLLSSLPLLVPLLCLILMIPLIWTADQRGRDNAARLYRNPVRKVFLFFESSESKDLDKELESMNCSGNLRPFFETKDALFVFAKVDAGAGKETFIVPLKSLVSIRSEPVESKSQSGREICPTWSH